MSEPDKLVGSESTPGAGVGQVMVIVGLLFLYGVGAFWLSVEVIFGKDEPWWLKIGLPTVVVGMTILFVTVLVQRIRSAKTDKYTDVRD